MKFRRRALACVFLSTMALSLLACEDDDAVMDAGPRDSAATLDAAADAVADLVADAGTPIDDVAPPPDADLPLDGRCPNTGEEVGGAAVDAPGDAGPASACTIPCLAALTRECEPAGTCTFSMPPLHNFVSCFANGVNINTRTESISTTVTVTKTDGSICYRAENFDLGDGGTLLVWKDGENRTVLTGRVDKGCNTLSVVCGIEKYVTSDPGACPAARGFGFVPRQPVVPTGPGCQFDPSCSLSSRP